MKFIVTGGAGYIGSHTIIELIENTDFEVVSIDNFSNSSEVEIIRVCKFICYNYFWYFIFFFKKS